MIRLQDQMSLDRLNKRNRAHRAPGFTLIELLVVMGIIVILATLLLPMVVRSFRQAGRTRTQADLQTVATALEAYKQDFGDYPRTDPAAADTGAATLGKSLLGVYGDGLVPAGTPDASDPPNFDSGKTYGAGDCVSASGLWVALRESTGVTPAAGTPEWAAFDPHDGADGPGFKTRTGATKTWGPYIASGKMKNRGTDLLDSDGGAILYFPARPGNIIVTDTTPPPPSPPYVDRYSTTPTPLARYNADDNFEVFRHKTGEADGDVLDRIRVMLGDYNHDGIVQTSNTPAETDITQPYLLWSPGPDGIYGPANFTPGTDSVVNAHTVEKSDDVTNFR